MHMVLKAYCDCMLFLAFEGTGLCKAYIWNVFSFPLINIQSEEKKTKGIMPSSIFAEKGIDLDCKVKKSDNYLG